MGGTFTNYNGTPANRLVCFHLDGQTNALFQAAIGSALNGAVDVLGLHRLRSQIEVKLESWHIR